MGFLHSRTEPAGRFGSPSSHLSARGDDSLLRLGKQRGDILMRWFKASVGLLLLGGSLFFLKGMISVQPEIFTNAGLALAVGLGGAFLLGYALRDKKS